jgi:hypothetical protein
MTASHPAAAAPWHRDPRAVHLVAVGAILVASGLAHVVIQAVQGGPWEGPVTWRKPILFGISGGLTSLSLAWVWAALPVRRGDRLLAAATAWALLVEVFLVDLQRWRGVASHFNRGTPLDSFLYDAMGVLILFVSLVIVDLTIRLFCSPSALPSDLRLAARVGMALLAISCGLGLWVSVHGDRQLALGLAPERYGAAGVPKFPHGVVIHAIQWLPAIAWAARRAGLALAARRRLVALASVATVALLAYALAQTITGRARFDVASWWRPAVAGEAGAGAAMRKIEFDLDALDAAGLAGPPDGKVAVSYEFRIPDTPASRAAVTAIDPEIEITTGPRGRVNAGPGFALCIGSTHAPRHRDILLAIARLPFVERIARCDFE